MSTGSRKVFFPFLARKQIAARRPAAAGPTLVSPGTVLSIWAALVALWALPYLTLLHHLQPDAAVSTILQWSLFAIGGLGVASVLYAAWRQSRDPDWRARHGLLPRRRPNPSNAKHGA